MLSHRSIREFSESPVSGEDVRAILEAVRHMPNWNNFQHVSVVDVRDKSLRQRVWKLCNGQQYVLDAPVFLVFCADFYRTWLACDESQEDFDRVTGVLDNVVVGATDVGIALGWAVAAAESLGLGTCVIGDARAHGPEMVEALGLPRYVFPVAGLCIGHPAQDPQPKPRLPQEAVCFIDHYDTNLKPLINQYDRDYRHYLTTRSGVRKDEDWSEQVASFYSLPYDHYPSVPRMLAQQGFFGA
jgi:FMN reductase [NAD(P)H]